MNDLQMFGAAAREAMEKDAAPLGALGKSLFNYAKNRALPAAQTLANKAVSTAKPVVDRAVTAAKPYADDVATRAKGVLNSAPVKAVTDRVSGAANRVATGVGTIGQLTQDAARGGLNMADDAARYAMNGPGSAAAAGGKFGDKVVRGVQTEAGRAFGTSPVGDKLNPLNLATGGGAIYGAGKATGMIGGSSGDVADPTPDNLQAQQHRSYDMQQQMQTQTGNNNSQGLMGMWNSLPIEARYAIGAGVPLALAGAVMGGRGNTGAGLGMGALGLGAAGLGAAGAGMFGDGARRMVGQGANALYGMVGGQSDPMSQMRMLGKLSPEFGTTALMGRDPNLGSQQARGMYDFMTQNQEAIERLMPQLQNNSVSSGSPVVKAGAYFAEKLAGRCWTGYEPVPGKAPYSNDSCRPVGSKKKKKEVKKAGVAGQGKTTMNAAPSSRGDKKLVDDKQRETNSPVPTDAKNTTQEAGLTAAEKQAFGAALGKAIGAGARGLMSAGRAAFQGAKAVGQGAAAAGRGAGAAVNAGANIVKGVAPLAQGVVGGVGAAAQGVGTGVNMAGKALSAASKSPLTAIPTAAAGIYGASQMGGMMPKGMPQFQSPITWGNQAGVQPMQSGRIDQPL